MYSNNFIDNPMLSLYDTVIKLILILILILYKYLYFGMVNIISGDQKCSTFTSCG